MTRVRQVYDMLTGEVWPHESAEEAELYPSLNRLLGGADPTAPVSRVHAEIAYQIARLGRLIDDIGDRTPDHAFGHDPAARTRLRPGSSSTAVSAASIWVGLSGRLLGLVELGCGEDMDVGAREQVGPGDDRPQRVLADDEVLFS